MVILSFKSVMVNSLPFESEKLPVNCLPPTQATYVYFPEGAFDSTTFLTGYSRIVTCPVDVTQRREI